MAQQFNSFEALLKDRALDSMGGWKNAIIEVADTMYVCHRWFESYMPSHTVSPSDLVAMTRLIAERKDAADAVDRALGNIA